MISYDGATFSNTSRTIPSFSSALTSWNPKLAVAEGPSFAEPDIRRTAQASGPDLGRAPAATARRSMRSARARGCVEEPTRGAQTLTLRSAIALGLRCARAFGLVTAYPGRISSRPCSTHK